MTEFSIPDMMDSIASTQRGVATAMQFIERKAPYIFVAPDDDSDPTDEEASLGHAWLILNNINDFLPEAAALMITALRGEFEFDMNELTASDPESD